MRRRLAGLLDWWLLAVCLATASCDEAADSSAAGAATGNGTATPTTVSGSTGWLSRYWDCCKPACGWSGNVTSGSPVAACDQQNQSLGTVYTARSACDSGGTAYMCWGLVPWEVSSTLAYGFVAASGSTYVCGRCFQLQFTGTSYNGSSSSTAGLSGKTMVVQVINNGGVGSNQFDLLVPGGGVGALNACSTQWGTTDLGAQYGGFLAGCSGNTTCVQQKCQTVFAGKPDLLAGCNWFLGWFGAADNPNVGFQQVACPSEITAKSGLKG
jgi:hypothetical protein